MKNALLRMYHASVKDVYSYLVGENRNTDIRKLKILMKEADFMFPLEDSGKYKSLADMSEHELIRHVGVLNRALIERGIPTDNIPEPIRNFRKKEELRVRLSFVEVSESGTIVNLECPICGLASKRSFTDNRYAFVQELSKKNCLTYEEKESVCCIGCYANIIKMRIGT